MSTGRETSNNRSRDSSRSSSAAARTRSRSRNSNNGTTVTVRVTVTELTTGRYSVSVNLRIKTEGRSSCSSSVQAVSVVKEGEQNARRFAAFVKSQLANRKFTWVRLYAIRLVKITDIWVYLWSFRFLPLFLTLVLPIPFFPCAQTQRGSLGSAVRSSAARICSPNFNRGRECQLCGCTYAEHGWLESCCKLFWCKTDVSHFVNAVPAALPQQIQPWPVGPSEARQPKKSTHFQANARVLGVEISTVQNFNYRYLSRIFRIEFTEQASPICPQGLKSGLPPPAQSKKRRGLCSRPDLQQTDQPSLQCEHGRNENRDD